MNDELLSGATQRVSSPSATEVAYQAPRYSEAAGVEHHPQITDFVPRRYSTIALLLAMGVLSTAGLAGLHLASERWADTIGARGIDTLELGGTGSIAAWLSAVILLLTAATCRVVYFLRRHRIDDIRGRYRVWYAAAGACLVMSANSVAGFHHMIAHALSDASGWSALRDGAAWWLLVGGVPLAWFALRAVVDARECRLAAALLLAAYVSFAVSLASYLGMMQLEANGVDRLVHAGALLAGHWLLLAGAVAYARYVVLDAQGLIPVRRKNRVSADADESGDEAAAPVSKNARGSRPTSDAEWIDGSRPERESYNDDDPAESRKLSKADRKKLRKLKAQSRAA